MVENGGRTPHGVRGLKSQQFSGGRRTGDGRTPHGVRGLKCFLHDPGAKRRYCRTPHGVRGLKLAYVVLIPHHLGRTPHGVRGLKYRLRRLHVAQTQSHPSRGAWIEIA